MKDLIDTVLEQVNVGDCLVFSNHCGSTSYEFHQITGKTKRGLKMRELKQVKHGNWMLYECAPAGKDVFADNSEEQQVRLKLTDTDAVCGKVGYSYYTFLYDKSKHFDRDGNTYQPDVYDWEERKTYTGNCD